MRRPPVASCLTLASALVVLGPGRGSAQPPPVVGGADSEGITSEQMYHQLFEQNRARRASRLAADGDCAGARAYAARTRSAKAAAAVRSLCPGGRDLDGGDPVEAEIAAFAADPRHALFAVVTPDMIRLLRNGQAVSLQDAYDRAVAERVAEARASVPPGGAL